MIYKTRKNALDFRNIHGYSNQEAIHIKSLLIKLNIITVFKPLADHFSGMAVKSGDNKFILINSNHSIGRQHFSICHELYHLFFDDNFKSHNSEAGKFDKRTNEFIADTFASYLIMPDDGIINLIPEGEEKKDNVQLNTILKIEHYFNCSRTALLFRLKELNLISDKLFNEYKSKIKVNAIKYGYSTKLYEKGNEGVVIGDFGAKSKHLFDNEKISESHYISLLNSIGIDLLNNEENNDEKEY